MVLVPEIDGQFLQSRRLKAHTFFQEYSGASRRINTAVRSPGGVSVHQIPAELVSILLLAIRESLRAPP